MSVWPVQCERAELGCGMVVSQAKEVLVAAIKENTARTTPWVGNKDSPHLLTEGYTRRLLDRLGLTLRASWSLHNGRTVLTEADLERWQRDTKTRILSTEII